MKPLLPKLLSMNIASLYGSLIHINDLVVKAGGQFLDTPETSDTDELTMAKPRFDEQFTLSGCHSGWWL